MKTSVTIIWEGESFLKNKNLGQRGWLSGLALPSVQGVILETRDRVPRRAPCMEPASPSACVSASLSLSLYDYHKYKKKKKRTNQTQHPKNKKVQSKNGQKGSPSGSAV